jgi:hypothetical protein
MKAYWGSGGIAPRILDLGTRWRWVVSFTPHNYLSKLNKCTSILYRENACWSRGKALQILTSAVDGDLEAASRFGRCIPWGRAVGTHWTAGWVDPRYLSVVMNYNRIHSLASDVCLEFITKYKCFAQGCLTTGCWGEYLDLEAGGGGRLEKTA